MLLSKNFLKDIPKTKKEIILHKMTKFNQSINSNITLNHLPKGYWLKRVKGTDIFKFRINNGDRVLFSFVKGREKNEILFLKYCNHDDQIRMALSIDGHNKTSSEIDLVYTNYEDDEFDKIIDEEYVECYSHNRLLDLSNIESILLEDDYITLLLDENNDDYMYYVNNDQYRCLQVSNKPLIIYGSAGSGKSMVAIHKLILNNEHNLNSLYITKTNYLLNNMKKYYKKYNTVINEGANLCTINELLLSVNNAEENKFIGFEEFNDWYEGIKLYCGREIDSSFIWTEILDVIKANMIDSTNLKTLENMKLTKYLNTNKSFVETSEKKVIYSIFQKYDKWLNDNELFDSVDLIKKYYCNDLQESVSLFDSLIIDEIQDMSYLELIFIMTFVKDLKYILLLGDYNQVIRPNYLNYNKLSEFIYSINNEIEIINLTKNYRNSEEVVKLINKLTSVRQTYIGKSKHDIVETHIRSGPKPMILKYSSSDLDLMFTEMSKRNYCAIIVNTNEEREDLKFKGKDISRVFTITEMKGLEYQNVLCYNILTKNYDIWESLYISDEKKTEYDSLRKRMLFNQFYLSITRSKNRIYFFEEKESYLFSNELNEFLCETNKYDILEVALEEESTINEWLIEAKKLEDKMMYSKALELYIRVNDNEGQGRCTQKIKEQKINTFNLLLNVNHESTIRIENEYGDLKIEHIRDAIELIKKSHDVDSFSKIELVYSTKNKTHTSVIAITGNYCDTFELANVVYRRLYNSENSINKKRITIHSDLYNYKGFITFKDEDNNHKDTVIIIYKGEFREIGYTNTRSDSTNQLLEKFPATNILNNEKLLISAYFENKLKADEYYNKGKFLEAATRYFEALELLSDGDPLKAGLYAQIGSCYAELNELELGEKFIEKAISYDEPPIIQAEYYNNLGVIQLRACNYVLAKKYFEIAMNNRSNYVAAQNNYNVAASMLGVNPTHERSKKIGRNEECPCGSGLKYKRCCGK